jgi:hypothetical protein
VISVVCFKWRPRPGYRSAYGPATVNTLRRMVARSYQRPHRFICVTDDAAGLDPGVEVVPLWSDHAELPNPSFRTGPSCFRRLRVFARDAGALLGERFCCIDLDTVVTGDLAPVLDRSEDFIAWRNPDPRWPLNGSMFMLTAGSRPQVWETFKPAISPARSHAAGCRGSDQGWMSYVLGTKEATWGPEDGLYSYQMEVAKAGNKLPKNARMVFFHGHWDPWDDEVHKVAPWVHEHYR